MFLNISFVLSWRCKAVVGGAIDHVFEGDLGTRQSVFRHSTKAFEMQKASAIYLIPG
jgi:hypothetical protein